MSSDCCSSSSGEEVAPAKFHASLNVSDLRGSVAFYRLLFGLEPAKLKSDYAKFELADPPLVLSLTPGKPAPGGVLNHFGIRVGSAESLVEVQRRLELGGFRTKREEGVECCYARQTKFWATDPDQTFWEIYVMHEDLDEHGEGRVPMVEELAASTGEPPTPARAS